MTISVPIDSVCARGHSGQRSGDLGLAPALCSVAAGPQGMAMWGPRPSRAASSNGPGSGHSGEGTTRASPASAEWDQSWGRRGLSPPSPSRCSVWNHPPAQGVRSEREPLGYKGGNVTSCLQTSRQSPLHRGGLAASVGWGLDCRGSPGAGTPRAAWTTEDRCPPRVHATAPHGLRTAQLPRPRTLTCSVHSFSAPAVKGLGHC